MLELLDHKDGTFEKFTYRFEDNSIFSLTLFNGDPDAPVIEDEKGIKIELSTEDRDLKRKIKEMLDYLEIDSNKFQKNDLSNLSKNEIRKKIDIAMDNNDLETVKELSKYLKESENVLDFNNWLKKNVKIFFYL
jgi:hypothetical protein